VEDPGAHQRFIEAVAEAMYARDNVARGLGIEIEVVRPDYARMRMTVREDMLNSHRICHGGVIFTFADSAFAYACNAENRATVATTCAISYASAAQLAEELTAIAEERVRQSRTGVYDITVTAAGDGRIVAVFRGNSYEVKGESVPGLNARLGRAET
jgi:acyl-CoA thioesterase